MNPIQPNLLPADSISKARERVAYEAYWSRSSTTFAKAAFTIGNMEKAQPSLLVSESDIDRASQELDEHARKSGQTAFDFRLRGVDDDFPKALQDAEHPVQALYSQGNWSYTKASRRIAVIGSRDVSAAGLARARRLVRLLVANNVVVISGLADGVDTAAHNEAIERGGKTIAVIGTSITDVYPKHNKSLQRDISEHHLLLSQIPILRYSNQDYRINRQFFPERNATMSAIAQGTVIVEASDRSGTLTQAKAALKQGRQLFILDSCFENKALNWPSYYENRGAIRVKQIEDIINNLPIDKE